MDMATVSITLVVILLIVVGVAFVLWNAICPAIAPEMENLPERPAPKPPVRATPVKAIHTAKPATPASEPDKTNVVDLAEWRNRRAS